MTSRHAVRGAMEGEPVELPPLTRNGYTRTARAERDIVSLWHLPGPGLAREFEQWDDPETGGRSTEALVFLLRREIARGDRRAAEALFARLVERCQRGLRGTLRGIDEDGRADIQADVLADMTRLVLADDDSGDFLQSRFWLYLRRRAVTARADWLRGRKREPLAEDVGEATAEMADRDGRASTALSPEDMAVLHDALDRLPPELRELMVLRHYEGWRVGDEPAERRTEDDPTLAERYGITPRAVRKRLARATAILTDNRNDQP